MDEKEINPWLDMSGELMPIFVEYCEKIAEIDVRHSAEQLRRELMFTKICEYDLEEKAVRAEYKVSYDIVKSKSTFEAQLRDHLDQYYLLWEECYGCAKFSLAVNNVYKLIGDNFMVGIVAEYKIKQHVKFDVGGFAKKINDHFRKCCISSDQFRPRYLLEKFAKFHPSYIRVSPLESDHKGCYHCYELKHFLVHISSQDCNISFKAKFCEHWFTIYGD